MEHLPKHVYVGKKIAPRAETCITCRDRTGKNNPFYGRTHSKKTKKLLSDNRKGCLPSNCREIFAEGIIYESLTAAGRAYSLTSGAMHNRVNSKREKWDEFFYCDEV